MKTGKIIKIVECPKKPQKPIKTDAIPVEIPGVKAPVRKRDKVKV